MGRMKDQGIFAQLALSAANKAMIQDWFSETHDIITDIMLSLQVNMQSRLRSIETTVRDTGPYMASILLSACTHTRFPCRANNRVGEKAGAQ